MIRYRVYGLTIQCDRPLFVGNAADDGTVPPDVSIVHALDEVDFAGPSGDRLLLDYREHDIGYFCEIRPNDFFRLVFSDACEFIISPDLREVVVQRHRGAVPGIEDVLCSGAMIAWQLYMRGAHVLHASAVQVDDVAIAFTGGSGRGKTTMATIMATAGAAIVTDDLLLVEEVDGVPQTLLGSSELRLRKGADELAAGFAEESAPRRRLTADERQALRPSAAAADRLPLAAIFVPLPGEAESTIRLERVPALQAVFGLLSAPRLYGWIDEDVTRRQFELTSALVKSVPVFLLHVPWGPPFSPEIAPRVIAELEAVRARPSAPRPT